MKKIIALLLVAVLSLAVLASCGGNKDPKETTKPTGETTTGPKTTTTTPPATTTEELTTTEATTTTEGTTNTTPPSEEEEIPQEALVTYKKKLKSTSTETTSEGQTTTEAETFEEFGRIYAGNPDEYFEFKLRGEEYVDKLLDVDYNNTASKENSAKKPGYTWVLKINDTEYVLEEENITLDNSIPSFKKLGLKTGSVVISINLSAVKFKAVKEQNHEYDITLLVKGTDGGVAYYINFGTVTYIDIPLMTPDPARVARNEVEYDYEKITPISGGYFNETENYTKLFDGSILTKLLELPGEGTPVTEIVFETEEEIVVVSYSLVTANDNATYKERNPLGWKFYGSNDGEAWVELHSVDESNAPARDTVKNFTEYNFVVTGAAAYKTYKLEITNGTAIQYSELLLFVAGE